jgi:hypothetical protein
MLEFDQAQKELETGFWEPFKEELQLARLVQLQKQGEALRSLGLNYSSGEITSSAELSIESAIEPAIELIESAEVSLSVT